MLPLAVAADSNPKLRFQVESIGKLAGLNSTDIQALYQDQDGYIWIGNKPGVTRFDGYTFQNYTKAKDQVLGPIYSIIEDRSGTVWVGGVNGLFYWQGGQFHASSIPKEHIKALRLGSQGELWVAGLGFVPFALSSADLEQLKTGRLVHIQAIRSRSVWEHVIGNFRVWGMDIDNNGVVWFGLDSRHVSYDGTDLNLHWKDTTVVHQYSAIAAFHQDSVFWGSEDTPALFQKAGEVTPVEETTNAAVTYIITKTDSATYFLTTFQLLELKRGKWTTLHTFDRYASLYFKNMILDREGNFWVGGVGDLLKLSPNTFEVRTEDDTPWVGSNHCIEQLSSGEIYIGGNQARVNLYHPDSARMLFQLDVPRNSILGDIEEHHDGLWFATSMGGLVFRKDGISQQYTTREGLRDNGQYFLRVDRTGDFWSGGDGGITKIIRNQGGVISFENYMAAFPGVDTDFPLFVDMFRGPDQGVWAIGDKGLYKIGGEELIHTKIGLASNPRPILTAVQRYKGQIWLSTQGEGLWQCQFASAEELQLVRRWTEKDGLLSDVLFDLHMDKLERIWVVSQGGICRINLSDQSGEVECFDRRDGWIDEASAHFRLLESEDSLLWAISKTSIVNFPLYNLSTNQIKPQAFINKVALLNGEDDIYRFSASPADRHLLPQNLILPYNKNFLEFQFSTTSHTQVAKNKFRYQLEGLNPAWSTPAEDRDILYSDLRPGFYTFHLMAANNSGLWGEKISFSFRILSPLWWRWWAILAYVVALIWGINKVYRFQLARQVTLLENKRLRELDQVKTNLYTNITHEFRTPLTVILGITQQIRKEAKKATLPKLQLIQRNSQQLFELINQMLDLSKLESGYMRLNLMQADIVTYLSYLVASFTSYAEQREIDLQFSSRKERQIMDFDPKVIQQVLSNLLSNALKFTPAGGEIAVELDEQDGYFQLQVRDTGEGIDEEQLKHIFDRFHQVDTSTTKVHEGTGIGLALVKEWVDHMKGRITVQSEIGLGSTFLLELPITTAATLSKAPVQESDLDTEPALSPALPDANPLNLPLVLLIEDNADVAQYLRLALANRYQCIHAVDGQEGVDMAWAQIPDLIISDVMMPQMDGYEVCRLLKNDERSSHIPIILLTAKVDFEDRMVGLSEGADAYLAKPFAEEELMIRMEKLLDLRKQLQQKYSRTFLTDTTFSSKREQIEDPFLAKVELAILEHLEKENFGSEDLAKALFLSRSQLHRKIKALTGKSASIYLRMIRLREAQKLLADPGRSISEIAYQVGFKSPVYFSQIYKETFGVPPSERRS
ncbi:MAG: response regulator [Saprospiraceae bacterium]|nr:response regulator [Saprospiraceae bacterium]